MKKEVVLVTGANGGIGQALCRIFTDRGWRVIATDLEEHAAAPVDHFLSIDLERMCHDDKYKDDLVSLLHESVPDGLHCLINNAASQIVAPIEELTAGNWQESLSVNVVAPFLLVQGLLGKLELVKGSVINIASIHAQLTKPGFSAYSTSKSGLVGLTRAMAVELGSRIRVNAIAPAAISTPMLVAGFKDNKEDMSELAGYHPANSIGEPEDVARLAYFMAGVTSQFLNGSIIGMDGGIASRLHDPG